VDGNSVSKSCLKILLIEDHHIMRRGLASLLKLEFGSEIVHEAANGLQALDMLENFKLDLVIMDMRMTHLNGLEATRQIGRNHPQAKVLSLTRRGSEE